MNLEGKKNLYHFPEKQGWIWVTFDYIAVWISISLNSPITKEGEGGVSKQGYYNLKKHKQNKKNKYKMTFSLRVKAKQTNRRVRESAAMS